VLVVSSAIGGFMVYRWSAQGPTTIAPLPAQAQAQAAPTPPAPQDVAVRAIPEEVPDVRLPDMAGQPHALRQNAGRARLYNFWASWCEPCRREIPLLNALQASYGTTDRLEIIGIAVDFHDAVRDFLAKTRLNYTSLVGEEEGLDAAQKFGMELALPFSVFADEHNRIVAIKVGELHRDEADVILGQLRALRAGATTLPAAKAAIAESMKALAINRAINRATKQAEQSGGN
jgi:thiol-disulfide isomerase/thioredoxin